MCGCVLNLHFFSPTGVNNHGALQSGFVAHAPLTGYHNRACWSRWDAFGARPFLGATLGSGWAPATRERPTDAQRVGRTPAALQYYWSHSYTHPSRLAISPAGSATHQSTLGARFTPRARFAHSRRISDCKVIRGGKLIRQLFFRNGKQYQILLNDTALFCLVHNTLGKCVSETNSSSPFLLYVYNFGAVRIIFLK